MRATVQAVQVRGECSYGTCRGSQQARLGPRRKKKEFEEEEEEEEEEALRDIMLSREL